MGAPIPDLLEAGRDALDRHAWDEAFEALSAADREGALPADGLRMLAEVAWWSAHPEVALEAAERAYAAYVKEGDRSAAAMMAFELARQHGSRMSMPQAAGWMAKAEEMAAEEPDAVVHGWLAWMRSLVAAVMQGDMEASIGHLDQALEIAERAGDRSLRGISLHDKGHALCLAGKVDEGMALMDQAMTATVGGELDAQAAGYVYCGMIAACSRLADYQRAGEWTEATSRWCERQSITGFPGVCRVHRAELMRLRGAWPMAEEEARLACEELPRFNMMWGLGYANYEIGEVRRRMGDFAAAEEAYRQAHEHGRSPQPGLSYLRLAQGKVGAASAAIRQAVAEATDDDLPGKARLLAAQAEIAVAAGDVETASAAAKALDSIVAGYTSTAMQALAACARGAVRLAEGNPEEAMADLRRSATGWREISAPYEAAEVRLLLGKAYRELGDEDSSRLELEAARSAFERLGARPAVERAGQLLGELSTASGTPERAERAFMFTDIVGSTDLVAAIGDEAWEGLLSWHDQTLRSLFAAYGGDVAHHTGDGFFAAFDDVRKAFECAIAIQRALVEHRRAHGFALQVRIGLHAAQATRRGQDYSGAEVHKAARISALAAGGEIFASATSIPDGELSHSEVGEVELKGFSEPVEVVRIDWR